MWQHGDRWESMRRVVSVELSELKGKTGVGCQVSRRPESGLSIDNYPKKFCYERNRDKAMIEDMGLQEKSLVVVTGLLAYLLAW